MRVSPMPSPALRELGGHLRFLALQISLGAFERASRG